MYAQIAEARKRLVDAERIVAFTGAGISAESGIPTFRGNAGLWRRVPPEVVGTVAGVAAFLQRDPRQLADLLGQVGRVVLAARPNPAHTALGAAGPRIPGIITQNVDDLHEVAGDNELVKLHGDLFRWRCSECGRRRSLRRTDLHAVLAQLETVRTPGDILAAVPRCSVCAQHLRPDVVLFGEILRPADVDKAHALAACADALLVVGTSGIVEPAAGIARRAGAAGIPLIEINPVDTALTHAAAVSLRGPAGTLVPAVLEGVLAAANPG